MEQQLCLSCGLCCNGVIFADVRLQPGDDVGRLKELGLALTAESAGATILEQPMHSPRHALQGLKFSQPCAALDGCACRIYGQRPTYCREFDCRLLKDVKEGRRQRQAAATIIRKALARADKVRQLLREFGDNEESLALSLRFQRLRVTIEAADVDAETAARYAKLTVAVHDLNYMLSQEFYPGK